MPETRFVVTPAGLKIGRTAPADIIVAGAGVSRAHCLVELAADKLRVTDLNSTNGTYIDNKRIEGSEILAVGSVLRVGNVSFEHEVRTRAEMQHIEALRMLRSRSGRSPERRVANDPICPAGRSPAIGLETALLQEHEIGLGLAGLLDQLGPFRASVCAARRVSHVRQIFVVILGQLGIFLAADLNDLLGHAPPAADDRIELRLLGG
jgi:hypothetical protein